MAKSRSARKVRRRGFQTLRDLDQAKLTPGEKKLRTYINAVLDGRRVPPQVLQFVATAFRKIFAGEAPSSALDLNQKIGRRELRASDYDLLGRAVWGEQYFGATFDEAVAIVARRFDVVEKTVRTSYKKSLETGGIPEGPIPPRVTQHGASSGN